MFATDFISSSSLLSTLHELSEHSNTKRTDEVHYPSGATQIRAASQTNREKGGREHGTKYVPFVGLPTKLG